MIAPCPESARSVGEKGTTGLRCDQRSGLIWPLPPWPLDILGDILSPWCPILTPRRSHIGKRRRARNEGSITQRDAGLYVIRIRLGRDPVSGKRQSKTEYAKTEEEAVKRLQELRQKYSKRRPDT